MKLNEIIGSNIRILRTQRQLSMEELAEMLEITPAFIGLIERGQRGATNKNLLKLSKIFDISIDYLFKIENIKIEEESSLLQTLNALTYNLKDEEINFIIEMIRQLKKHNQSL